MRLLLGLLVSLCALAPPALAAPPTDLGPGSLVYQWPTDAPLHYRVQMYMATPNAPIRFIARANLDARVTELTVALLLRCTAGDYDPSARAREVDCQVHRAELGGAAFPGEQAKMIDIFREYQDLLMVSTVQLQVSERGAVRSVDIEGVEKGTSREAQVHEMLRMLVGRAIAPMELELPRDGDPQGRRWRQKGSPQAMRLPSVMGTAGGVRLYHEVESVEGNVALIRTTGQGLLNPGGTEAINTVSAFLNGTARYDIENKRLISNEQTLQGVSTAQGAGIGDDLYINQVNMLELLPSFEEADQAAQEAKRRAEEEREKNRQVLEIDPTLQARDPADLNQSIKEAIDREERVIDDVNAPAPEAPAPE